MTRFGQRANDGVVHIRPAGNYRRKDGSPTTGQISVPAYMMRLVPLHTSFRAELTEDGILFRFVDGDVIPEAELPEWVKAAQERKNGSAA